MKNKIVIVSLMFCMSAYGEMVVNNQQERNGLYYEVNQEEPYTGNLICKWSNGQKRTDLNYKNGKMDGLATI